MSERCIGLEPKHDASETRDDRGFSLVELAIYIGLLGIIVTIVATLTTSLFKTEQTVSELTDSSNTAQVAVTALNNDIINARSFTTNAAGTVLIVSTADGASDWKCVRWRVSGTTLERALGGTVTGAHWQADIPIATGVALGEAGKFFSGESATATGTLEYSFVIPTTGGGEQDLTGRISNRAYQSGSTCPPL